MGCKVLIVDDDKIILRQLLDEFKQTDFEVEVVDSSEKAITLFDSQSFDIVFTDLILAGKSGVDLCVELKRISPKTEIVLMSGRPEDIEKHQMVFLSAGGRDEVLRKPLLANEVLDVAKKIYQELEKIESNS